MDPRMGIQELLARRPRPAPKQEINVVGGGGGWSTVTLRSGLKTQGGYIFQRVGL
jgi:hypothetical protein